MQKSYFLKKIPLPISFFFLILVLYILFSSLYVIFVQGLLVLWPFIHIYMVHVSIL